MQQSPVITGGCYYKIKNASSNSNSSTVAEKLLQLCQTLATLQ